MAREILELHGPWFRHPDGRFVDAKDLPKKEDAPMPPDPVIVIPEPTPDQSEYLTRIAETSGKYDPSAMVGGSGNRRDMDARGQIAESLRQILFKETTDSYLGSVAVGFEMNARDDGIRLSFEAAETIMRLLKH